MKNTFCIITLLFTSILLFVTCKKKNDGTPRDSTINLFSINDDKNLGAQVAAEIDNNPKQYPLLDSVQYKDAYAYLYRLRNNILNSGKVKYKDTFAWRLRIIRDDSTLNAFCTPGGYIYVYTGLIKYLDTEDELAGVLGHEIAHADRRHSTDAMTRDYGLQLLFDIVLGKGGNVSQIAKNMLSLKYSRGNESEADEYSVIYLSGTEYQCSGAAGFFEKLEANGVSCGGVQKYFSTHPCPDNRITNIKTKANSLACNTSPIQNSDYQKLKTQYIP